IHSISIAKGYDPRDHVLVAFGAAGPQHACAVARDLGITKILIHPDAGVLSALGIGLADIVKHRSAGVYRVLGDDPAAVRGVFDRLEQQARDDILAETGTSSPVEIKRSLDVRFCGADAPLSIVDPENGDYATAF